MTRQTLQAILAPALVGSVLVLLASGTAQAQSKPLGRSSIVHKIQSANERLEMVVNTSRILTLDHKIPTAQVNNPDVLDLTPLSPTQIQISAKKSGVTQVNLWDENEQIYAVDVIVLVDTSELSMLLSSEFPNASIQVTPVSNGVLISGYVDQHDHVSRIVQIAEEYYPKVLTNLQVGGVHQVLLHVKVIEVSRTKLRALGLDWTQMSGADIVVAGAGVTGAVAGVGGPGGLLRIGGSDAFDGMLEAMRKDSLAKILAEPTLVTVSGRPAFFEVGGEIGYIRSVDRDGVAQIGWKLYGTRVDFVPIVLGNGRIRLEVRPRVSEIDRANSINNILALRTREVDTGVELKAGQTLAIAGLIQNRVEAERRGIPWVSEIPYLGTMFRRVEEKNNEVELIILVTPELVGPMDADQVPRCGPGMQTTAPNDWQLFMRGHIEVPNCCTNCGGRGCSQCAGQGDGAEPVLTKGSGTIGDEPLQEHPSGLPWSNETPDTRASTSVRTAPMPEVIAPSQSPKAAQPPKPSAQPSRSAASDSTSGTAPEPVTLAPAGVPRSRHKPSSPQISSAASDSDTPLELPGFMGPIGYDVTN